MKNKPAAPKTISAQRVNQAYDQKKQGNEGRFGTLNPCYGCGKSAGQNYFSHNMTDTKGWDDLALVLCEHCAEATGHMVNPLEFITFAENNGGMTSQKANRIRHFRSIEGGV